jgi:hypothetical protein
VKEKRTAGSARTDGSAPLSRGEFSLDKQRILGDLISYRNDGKGFTAITGKVENT